jgi:hypothetical protein
LAEKAVGVIWELSGQVYFAAVTTPSGEVAFYLFIEPVRSRWHWAVWRPNEDEQAARHGLADTVHEAMLAAERALEARRS